MFNWTTTTLINEIPSCADGGDKVRIGKYLFEKRWVESIRKNVATPVEICEATVDLSAVNFGDATVARLYIYVGLEGSEESIYANDWYRKGMPLSVSFAVSEDASVMAKAIEDTVNTFNVFTKVKKVLDVKANGSVVTIKGTHEHQRLQKIAVLVENTDSILGEEKAVVEFEKGRKDAADVVTIVKPGVNGFGTYSQLVKDLRLPTAANTNWLSTRKDEMPVVGALYTQYIINYYAPSAANPSFTAVGNRSMSETTHVFWVREDLVPDWEAILATIDPDGGNIEEDNVPSSVVAE